MYAVVRTGGKQLRVAPGDRVWIETVSGAPGDRIELSEVLFVGGGGDGVRVGRPLVEGAKVIGTIQGAIRGPKIRIFKHKRRKGYRLRQGHRQNYTTVQIDAIEV